MVLDTNVRWCWVLLYDGVGYYYTMVLDTNVRWCVGYRPVGEGSTIEVPYRTVSVQ